MDKLQRINCGKLTHVEAINIDATINMSFDKFCKEYFDVVFWTEVPIRITDVSRRVRQICMEQMNDGRELLIAESKLDFYIKKYKDVIVAKCYQVITSTGSISVASSYVEENTAVLAHTCHLIINSFLKNYNKQEEKVIEYAKH